MKDNWMPAPDDMYVLALGACPVGNEPVVYMARVVALDVNGRAVLDDRRDVIDGPALVRTFCADTRDAELRGRQLVAGEKMLCDCGGRVFQHNLLGDVTIAQSHSKTCPTVSKKCPGSPSTNVVVV